MKISREFKIGLFAAFALAALYFGYNFLRGKRLFSNLNTYYVVYNEIDGIVKSTPIYYKGLKVGQVEKLSLFRTDSANRILVTMLIDAKITLSRTSEAKIVTPDILGGKAISLIIPNLIGPLDEYDTIPGTEEVSLTATLTPVKDKTESVLITLNKVLLEVHKVLSNGGTQQLSAGLNDLSGTLRNLNIATARINELIVTESVKLVKVTSNFELISNNIRKSNDDIGAGIHNFRKISDSLAAAPLKSTIEQINKTTQQLAILTNKLNAGEGSAGKLLNDKQLYDNLTKSSFELQALLKDLHENPSRYVNISVFGSKKAKK